jgi:hypothetical protein
MQDVPQFVLKRLRETAVAGSHPDADLLTAFAEQSLPVSEKARVIEHLAACGNCRDVVALVLPATEIEVSPVSSTRVRSVWLGLPLLRWGALAAGLTILISVGVLQYSHRRNGDMVASNRSREIASLPSAAKSASSTQTASPQTEAGTQPSAVLDSPAPSGQQAAVEVSPRDRAAGRRSVFARPRQKAKNPVSQQVAQNEAQLLPDAGNVTNLRSFDVVKAKDPVPAQSTSSNVPASLASATPLQTSPSLMLRALPRWMVSSSGVLQRSFDRGNTWEKVNPALSQPQMSGYAPAQPAVGAPQANSPQLSPSKAAVAADPGVLFRAVAALGLEVWAGASGGVLYHTSDGGGHWTRVTPSIAAAGLTGDIIGIQFADPQHGTISTSNAELWTTSDSGQTWQKQQ